MEVLVHLNRELGISFPKALWVGATVWDLKEALARDDPTGQARSEDLVLAAATGDYAGWPLPDGTPISPELWEFVICIADGHQEATPEAAAGEAWQPSTEWPVESEVDWTPQPCEYRVLQGPLLKKPGADPATPKVVKLKRKVASTVKTTGRTWKGPAGGEWVELDPSAEKPGWLLIEGPGFDVQGPLLDRVEAGEDPPMVLSCFSAIAKSTICEVCVKPTDTVKTVQSWINLHTPGNTKLSKIWCMKAEPADVDGSHFLKTFQSLGPDQVLQEEGFQDGGNVVFIIVGQYGEFT